MQKSDPIQQLRLAMHSCGRHGRVLVVETDLGKEHQARIIYMDHEQFGTRRCGKARILEAVRLFPDAESRMVEIELKAQFAIPRAFDDRQKMVFHACCNPGLIREKYKELKIEIMAKAQGDENRRLRRILAIGLEQIAETINGVMSEIALMKHLGTKMGDPLETFLRRYPGYRIAPTTMTAKSKMAKEKTDDKSVVAVTPMPPPGPIIDAQQPAQA